MEQKVITPTLSRERVEDYRKRLLPIPIGYVFLQRDDGHWWFVYGRLRTNRKNIFRKISNQRKEFAKDGFEEHSGTWWL